MTMNVSTLADAIKNAIGHSDVATSSQTTGLATAIIDEVKAAVVTNAPGTVLGTAPSSGGALVDGEASNGVISGMTKESLAGLIKTEVALESITPQLLGLANAIVVHVMIGKVSFAKGKVIGPCSNTTNSPGALTGLASDGKIAGISGDDMATLAATGLGESSVADTLKAMCNVIANHIMDNGVVAYVSQNVVATCSAGGGPISAGAATLGKIT
jgi:hypothetical protein